MRNFIFTVDDNIRFLKEINEREYESIFEHPYLAMYRRLHEKYGLKVQLNLFYEMEGFDLSRMTTRYKDEWKENADWLKMSFHSRRENVKPYENSGYKEVFFDMLDVEDAICDFASWENSARTTTIHYCLLTSEGVEAVTDTLCLGLLGLYGTEENPRTSYQTDEEDAVRIRRGETVEAPFLCYAGIDIVLNMYSVEEILKRLDTLLGRDCIKVMIHEQYFYPDYKRYQPNFEEKLEKTFEKLMKNGYESVFFEETLYKEK